MRPTIEWMKENYEKFNGELFNGELGDCDFSLNIRGTNPLGKFQMNGKRLFVHKSTREMFVKGEFGGEISITRENFARLARPMISLNPNYDSSEEALLDTLIHEMCHYYTYRRGYAPKQAHGGEFKGAARLVEYRSGGRFKIQRLATAEEMSQRTLDPALQAQQNARMKAKNSKTIVLLIYRTDGEVELIKASSRDLATEIIDLWRNKKSRLFKKILVSTDSALIEFLCKQGYASTMRTYRYWSVGRESWINDIEDKFKFTTVAESVTVNEGRGQYIHITPDMELSQHSPLEMDGIITESDIREVVRECICKIIQKSSLKMGN